MVRKGQPQKDLGEELSRQKDQADVSPISAAKQEKLLCPHKGVKPLTVRGATWQQVKETPTVARSQGACRPCEGPGFAADRMESCWRV